MAVLRWFDTQAGSEDERLTGTQTTDWVRMIPFVGLHVGCLGVFWVGWSWIVVAMAAALYFLRMFAITAFYHRYFSHRTFKTSRSAQFLFALLGNLAVQRGPLWWAAHHRHHHLHSDEEEDVHSPHQYGFYWSHCGWITSRSNFPTKRQFVKDLAEFPELQFLNRFDSLIPILLAVSLYLLGYGLDRYWPELGTSGPQMLVWAFFVSTVVLFHGTCLINSIAHMIGNRRFDTRDESRNSLLLALVTLGEGWHNNHHRFPSSVRQGLYWWEVDITYYILLGLERLGVIWDLHGVSERIWRAEQS